MNPQDLAKRAARKRKLCAELRAAGLCKTCRKADRKPAVKGGRCAEHHAENLAECRDRYRASVARLPQRERREQPADVDELDRDILARGYLSTFLDD